VTSGVQLSKNEGCRIKIESPITERVVNLKIGDAVSSRNVFFFQK